MAKKMAVELTGALKFAAKTVTSVEAGKRVRGDDKDSSHQHELNGTAPLREYLGPIEFRSRESLWIDLLDEVGPVAREMRTSWYDARRSVPHRAAEWRLYYSGAPDLAEGDLIVLLKAPGALVPVFYAAPRGSTWHAQLLAILGVPAASHGSIHKVELASLAPEHLPPFEELLEAAGLGARIVLEPALVGKDIASCFPDGMPSTKELSATARMLAHVESEGPDEQLTGWWATEELLFRRLEETELKRRLAADPPFEGVDDFISFSLSVHNRRKSRAGHALENHFEALLAAHGVKFSRGAQTEGARRPDFVLPSIDAYRDDQFPSDDLIILAAKTTCKDRWRQILNEAARTRTKHLLTLEPSISRQQLTEMRDEGVVLVAPRAVLATYDVPDGMTCLTVESFISMALARQTRRMS